MEKLEQELTAAEKRGFEAATKQVFEPSEDGTKMYRRYVYLTFEDYLAKKGEGK